VYVAGVQRRQGKWAEATAGFERALALDPHNPASASEVVFTLMFQRRWEAASQAAQNAIALGPDLLNLAIRTAYLDFWWKNDTAALHALLASTPAGLDPDGLVTLARWDLAMLERDFDAAERAISACKLDTIIPFGTPLPKSYLQACTTLARGDFAAAHPLLDNARQYFESQVQSSPTDTARRSSLALVYSYLGRHDEAVRTARKAVELLPESRDAILGPDNEAVLALVYARAGNNDEAIKLISRLLTVPGGITAAYESNMTVADLRRRWQWDPLRNDERFQRILANPEPRTR
jgi:tetratricopeptide (TPR) repeat protein